MADVTQILCQIDDGDPSAAAQLLPIVYDELRQLAAAKMAQEAPGQTLVHHPDEKTVFNVASAIDSPELRQTYLDQICGDNPSLRSRVLHLLQMHNEEPEFLEASPVGVATIDAPQIAETLGDQIGPYRLRERIAEGGMGVVYVAEQSQPVARKVALKAAASKRPH